MDDVTARTKNNQAVPIAEAAQILGVSERTIYRMVRAGRLVRVSMSDKNDMRVRVMIPEQVFTNSNLDLDEGKSGVYAPDNVVSMSDNLVLDRLERLEHQLTLKDAQIAELMRQQREMLEAVQRSNEQMFELIHLLLLQHRSTTAASQASVDPAGQGWLDRLKQLLLKQNS